MLKSGPSYFLSIENNMHENPDAGGLFCVCLFQSCAFLNDYWFEKLEIDP